MSDIVPLIFSQEQAQIKEELNGKDLSVILMAQLALASDGLLCPVYQL